jgi:hypothetical protein
VIEPTDKPPSYHDRLLAKEPSVKHRGEKEHDLDWMIAAIMGIVAVIIFVVFNY